MVDPGAAHGVVCRCVHAWVRAQEAQTLALRMQAGSGGDDVWASDAVQIELLISNTRQSTHTPCITTHSARGVPAPAAAGVCQAPAARPHPE